MNLIPYIASWGILAVVVLALLIYRISVARRDDATLHVLEQNPNVIAAQNQAIQKIKAIDHWGEALTIITVGYGLVIALVYLHYLWVMSTQMPKP
jgi:hypothetical protein